jgi:hypothetical protein
MQFHRILCLLIMTSWSCSGREVMQHIPVNLAIEDVLSEAVLRVVIARRAQDLDVNTCLRCHGQGYLKKNIERFNEAARVVPFIVLADLDLIECAPDLVADWLHHVQSSKPVAPGSDAQG